MTSPPRRSHPLPMVCFPYRRNPRGEPTACDKEICLSSVFQTLEAIQDPLSPEASSPRLGFAFHRPDTAAGARSCLGRVVAAKSRTREASIFQRAPHDISAARNLKPKSDLKFIQKRTSTRPHSASPPLSQDPS